MFKIGDKVIVKDNCGYWGFDGKEAIVVGVGNSDYPIHADLLDHNGRYRIYVFAVDELELVK